MLSGMCGVEGESVGTWSRCGQLVGTGVAIDIFGAVYWGFEGEGGGWERVDLMQLYTVF